MKKYRLETSEKIYEYTAKDRKEALALAKEKLGELTKPHELKELGLIHWMPFIGDKILSYWKETETS